MPPKGDDIGPKALASIAIGFGCCASSKAIWDAIWTPSVGARHRAPGSTWELRSGPKKCTGASISRSNFDPKSRPQNETGKWVYSLISIWGPKCGLILIPENGFIFGPLFYSQGLENPIRGFVFWGTIWVLKTINTPTVGRQWWNCVGGAASHIEAGFEVFRGQLDETLMCPCKANLFSNVNPEQKVTSIKTVALSKKIVALHRS